jgi:hypothetical protein
MSRVRLGIILLVISAGIWTGCGGPRVQLLDPTRPFYTRPIHFGLSLPVPISAALWQADSLWIGQAEHYVPVILHVNRKGGVTGFDYESPDDSAAVTAYVSFLKSLKFEPGVRDGARSDMRLRLELQAGAANAKPLVLFPIGPNREVVRSRRYWAALAANGVEPARVTSFPSYYYETSTSAVGNRYDYMLFRVDLDSLGRATAVILVGASNTKFTDQICSAIKWGEFVPTRLNNRPVASSNFLVVALLPDLDYPTDVWSEQTAAGRSIGEQLRIHLVPDTIGEMMLPIVKRDWSGALVDSAIWEFLPNLVSAHLAIDTTGGATLKNFSVDSWKLRRQLSRKAFDCQFYPARDFSGEYVPWNGLVLIRYLNASHIKTWFDWFPDADPGPQNDSVVAPIAP